MQSTTNPYTGEINSWITTLTECLDKNDLRAGRMICLSKSTYRDLHPNGKPIFNACIYDTNAVQVWWGDLDLVEDNDKLQKVANESNQEFYVTTESYRSDFNKTTKEELEKGMNPEHSFMIPVIKFKPSDKNE